MNGCVQANQSPPAEEPALAAQRPTEVKVQEGQPSITEGSGDSHERPEEKGRSTMRRMTKAEIDLESVLEKFFKT